MEDTVIDIEDDVLLWAINKSLDRDYKFEVTITDM